MRLARPHATLLTDLELPVLRADQAAGPPAPEGALDGLGPFAVARAGQGRCCSGPADAGAFPRPAHSVLLRTVHDENARAMRLEAGKADVAVNLISPALLPPLEASGGLARRVHGQARTTPTPSSTRSTGRSETWRRVSDGRWSAAIDRATICASLLGGRAHPAGDLVAPAGAGRSAGSRAAAVRDPAGAEERPSRARTPRGSPVTILTSTEAPSQGDVVRFIAQELRDMRRPYV